MSTTETALTAHLVMPQGVEDDRFYLQLRHDLHDRFGVEHVTLQVERVAALCPQALAEVV
ncbi:hypothetical protein [Deinococcus sonorensis]|uniref:Cation transporter n=2 Tax=Deinococcus sonorensis TaxID=309891 RepID=A0AAU7UEN6_9DEIO